MKWKMRLSRLVPLGLDVGGQLRWLGWGAAAGAVTELRFPLVYGAARQSLYFRRTDGPVLRTDAVIEPFRALLGWSLYGCFAAMAAMAVLAFWYWRGHYRGSRAIDLMRRLPNRRELPRRCLGLPLVGLGLFALEAGLFFLLNLGIYLLGTPAQCLPPDIWRGLGY